MRNLIVRILKTLLSIFEGKSKNMEARELHDSLREDFEETVRNLLDQYEDTITLEENSAYIIPISGNKFGLEIDIFDTQATIKTFHLIRHNEVFNQYRKQELVEAKITAVVEGEGQVLYHFGTGGVTYLPTKFNTKLQTHLALLKEFLGKI